MDKRVKEKRPAGIDCLQCPLRSLGIFDPFSQDELKFIRDFKIGELVVDAGATLIEEGSNSPHLYTVLEGWATRYTTLSDGGRQILNFALPGDFLGLQSSMFTEMDHSVVALTDLRLCIFPRERIWDLFRNYPSLAYDLTWLATHEERVLGAHLVALGQKTARSRVAFVLLRLYQRCEPLGLAANGRMDVPFSQQHLADLLGLSLVHTNKTLNRMEADGLLSWQKGCVILRERGALAELADFEEPDSCRRPMI